MKKIPLTQGKFALVDDEDYAELSQNKWHFYQGYAKRNQWDEKRVCHTVRMHRLIMDAPRGVEVDHINGDGIDNRKTNLRLCSHRENCKNSRAQIDNTSGYKGVTWHKGAKKWMTQIISDGVKHNMGLFVEKKEAARAYNLAAKKLHGEFARLNKVNDDSNNTLDSPKVS